MLTEKKRLIPARYLGHHVTLDAASGPYYNTDGTRRTSLSLSRGDELLMPDTEVLGQTYLRDQTDTLLHLGAGQRRLPEHTHLSDEELTQLGVSYEYHMGRPDMEPIQQEEQLLQGSRVDMKTEVEPDQLHQEDEEM